MSTQVRLNDAQVRAVLSGKNGPVWLDIQRRGNRVLNASKRLVPVDEGRLKNSLTMEMGIVDGVPTARVGSNLDYAIYVHEGTGWWSKTKPGYIRPVRAKALRWPVKNNSGQGRRRYKGGATAAYVYSKRSRGYPGRPYLTTALKYAGTKSVLR